MRNSSHTLKDVGFLSHFIVNTKCIEGKDYEFIDDKTKDHIGDVQKLLFICEQVSVHFLVKELHTERGVEGQVSRCDMECIVKDF